MAVQDIKNRFNERLGDLGSAAMHALFPNDFEYYLFALELVNSAGDSVEYFTFPVTPQSVEEVKREITNVRKSMGGVNVIKNPSFVPREINIIGDFGRVFKVVINSQRVEFSGLRFSTNNGFFKKPNPGQISRPTPVFSSFAKTGYGCVKIIEAIREKSKQLDEFNKPYGLYCYNPILGNNYQVEFVSMTHRQDKESNNMIPRYNIQLIATAPLESLLSSRKNIASAIRNLSFANIQKTANRLSSRIRRSINI